MFDFVHGYAIRQIIHFSMHMQTLEASAITKNDAFVLGPRRTNCDSCLKLVQPEPSPARSYASSDGTVVPVLRSDVYSLIMLIVFVKLRMPE